MRNLLRSDTLAFSPDLQFFLLGCQDVVLTPGRTHADGYEQLAGQVLVYDRAGVRIGLFQAHDDRIIALAIATDGRLLTATSKEVRLWDSTVWQSITAPTLSISIALQMVTAATFVSGGGRFAVATCTGEIRVYDSYTGRPLHTLMNQQNAGGLLAASPDGRTLVSALGEDPEVKAYTFARVWRMPE